MTDGFTVVMFVLVMFLFLVLAYSSGALNTHLRSRDIYERRQIEYLLVTEE